MFDEAPARRNKPYPRKNKTTPTRVAASKTPLPNLATYLNQMQQQQQQQQQLPPPPPPRRQPIVRRMSTECLAWKSPSADGGNGGGGIVTLVNGGPDTTHKAYVNYYNSRGRSNNNLRLSESNYSCSLGSSFESDTSGSEVDLQLAKFGSMTRRRRSREENQVRINCPPEIIIMTK